jgi:hypothetical protein
VDGSGPGGIGSGTGRAIVYANDAPIGIHALFSGLGVGVHTVGIYVRGFADSCTLNFGNFPQEVLVEELA